MKVLFVGGTGNISGAVSRLAVERGIDLVLLNRGRHDAVSGARALQVDYADGAAVEAALGKATFDAVVNWIAFTPDQVERDERFFASRTRQYVFISSASAYQKPPRSPFVTESTPLKNPWWQYSRDKIACVVHRVDPEIGAGLLGDRAHSVLFDNSKIKRLVPGFGATIPFHEGIRRTIAWFEADPSRWLVKPEVHAAMDRIVAAWERLTARTASAPGR
jgi:nucleoside-diphosphate-sugar epimerase